MTAAMLDSSTRPASRHRFPAPRMLLAALAALLSGLGFCWAYQSWSNAGTRVSILFQEGHGVRPGASIRSRGVTVGQVSDVRLSEDGRRVLVQLTLRPDMAGLARTGTRWWIVRPTVSLTQGFSGLDTALGDPQVGVQPGPGEPACEFTGDEEQPLPEAGKGLSLILRASQRPDGLRAGAPVLFRGWRIGWVRSVQLSEDGSHVRADLLIEDSYRRHVCGGVSFRPVGIASMDGSLMKGFRLHFKIDGLAGGVEMMPPPRVGSPVVKDGHLFDLRDG